MKRKQDAVFESPLTLFKLFPYNETFVDSRDFTVVSTPNDNPTSETYTFYYRGSNYGLLKTNKATLNADVAIRVVANGNLSANDVDCVPVYGLLRHMFKTKNLEVNGVLVTTSLNSDHLISNLRTIMTEIRKLNIFTVLLRIVPRMLFI